MQATRIRLTAQRLAVLELIQQSADHPTANEIFRRVQAVHPGLAYGTVYTALRALVTEGLIHELKFGDGASRYDGRLEEHHHVLCLGCGALAEVTLSVPAEALEAVARETGFDLQRHHIQFTGYCPACRAKR